ncbi:MAG: hypothetical protein ACHQAX_08075, partial [Gammaproteobacteria bacterium]
MNNAIQIQVLFKQTTMKQGKRSDPEIHNVQMRFLVGAKHLSPSSQSLKTKEIILHLRYITARGPGIYAGRSLFHHRTSIDLS